MWSDLRIHHTAWVKVTVVPIDACYKMLPSIDMQPIYRVMYFRQTLEKVRANTGSRNNVSQVPLHSCRYIYTDELTGILHAPSGVLHGQMASF